MAIGNIEAVKNFTEKYPLPTRAVYEEIGENTRLTLVMQHLLAISIIDSRAAGASNRNVRRLHFMRSNGFLISICNGGLYNCRR